jgi:type I restriction enzyme R subunit
MRSPWLIYSPYATAIDRSSFSRTWTKTKKWYIDLVLFMNGVPVVTLELKSEFKQAV